MIVAASSNERDDNLKTIFYRIFSVYITEKVIQVAIKLLFERQRDLTLKDIWAGIWKDAAIPVEDKYIATWLTHAMAGLEMSDFDLQKLSIQPGAK